MTDIIVTTIVGVLAIGGALFVLISAIAMLRVDDAISRINVLSPATGLGLPMLVAAAYVYDFSEYGFDVIILLKAIVAIAGFVIMSSVASNTLGRATYRSGAPIDPDTSPNELADRPERTHQDLP
ncbi:monovalent cation/H(+) antiporter subunit G [Ornithinimicrobium sp. INDO-MA30-4]|uniref:cation:proton antiporter n=1 Tax=Ornithinimicrobium sp. INDO-MA30-4 TaxID=2908651 RepID=UPI001F48B52D|nr:monovalent cation/H(+) antiporter subunit G [Ornithinimicrobium sp. INDO-MA30-4]UJH70426.1 monovalent cation/H(+) antiporter subunit G [Ornithinimicrobium sp. INDO-MA30-4]